MDDGIGKKLIDEVEMELRTAIRKKRYYSFPGRYWIEEKINDEGLLSDQDWGNPGVFRNNVKILAEEAIKMFNKGQGGIQASWSSLAQLVEIGRRVLPLVQELRQRLWGKLDAPFADDPEGREAALSWFRRAIAEEAYGANVQHPGQVEISLLLKTDDFVKLMARVASWRATQVEKGGPISAQESLGDLSSSIVETKCWAVDWRVVGEHETLDGENQENLLLEFSARQGQKESFLARPGTLLRELSVEVSHIAKESASWSTSDTLDFILFGSPPYTTPTLLTSEQIYASFQVHEGETRREMIQRLRKWLDVLDLPSTLSHSQRAVLTLVALTPNHSWGKRYKKWLEWCDDDPELPDFNRNPKSGPPSLYNTYKRAAAKQRGLDQAKAELKLILDTPIRRRKDQS